MHTVYDLLEAIADRARADAELRGRRANQRVLAAIENGARAKHGASG